MNPAFFMAFSFLVLSLLTGLRRDVDFFAPWRIFIVVWSIAIGLASMNLSGFQHVWGLKSWLILLLGLLSFLLGLYVQVVLHSGKMLLPIAGVRQRLSSFPLNELALFRIIIALFVLYGLAFVAEVRIEGGLPFYSPRPDTARVRFGIFGIHLLVSMMPVILFLVVEYLFLTHGSKWRKYLLLAVFLITAGSFFLLLQRFAFVLFGVTAFGLLYYATKTWTWRRALWIGSAIAVTLVYIQSFRFVRYVENYLYVV